MWREETIKWFLNYRVKRETSISRISSGVCTPEDIEAISIAKSARWFRSGPTMIRSRRREYATGTCQPRLIDRASRDLRKRMAHPTRACAGPINDETAADG